MPIGFFKYKQHEITLIHTVVITLDDISVVIDNEILINQKVTKHNKITEI